MNNIKDIYYNKISINDTLIKSKLSCFIVLLIALSLLSITCGCKKKKAMPPKPKAQQEVTKNELGFVNYIIVLPAKGKRQIMIKTGSGKASLDMETFTLTDISASLLENSVEVASITAENCTASLIDKDQRVAKISGNVKIHGTNQNNKIEIITNEVTWQSNSSTLKMEKFTAKLNEKDTLTAVDGIVSTDLKTFKYKNPKLEINK